MKKKISSNINLKPKINITKKLVIELVIKKVPCIFVILSEKQRAAIKVK